MYCLHGDGFYGWELLVITEKDSSAMTNIYRFALAFFSFYLTVDSEHRQEMWGGKADTIIMW